MYLFNFQENFSAIFKMAFPITVMANFSIGGTFTKVVIIFTKLAFFNCLKFERMFDFCILNVLKSCADQWSRLTNGLVCRKIKNLFGSMTSKYNLGKSHEDNVLSKGYHLCHKQSYFFIKESWKNSNSHSELRFFSSVTKSWKFCPSCDNM